MKEEDSDDEPQKKDDFDFGLLKAPVPDVQRVESLAMSDDSINERIDEEDTIALDCMDT